MSTILQKIKSVKLCLMAHPDNEEHSEFSDRISDLEEIEKELSKDNWIKIESENDNPKEEGLYWCVLEGGITILHFDFDDMFWKEHYLNLKPTHYKKVISPEPPTN